MQPSAWLYDYLKGREQFRPTAFKPTKDDVWTLAYGHTKGVKEGDTCTMAEGLALLQADVAWAVDDVNKHVTYPLNQAEFDALVSFVYNVGGPNFNTSTLLRDINGGHVEAAADELLKWDHQGAAILAGLLTRRKEERTHFLGAA